MGPRTRSAIDGDTTRLLPGSMRTIQLVRHRYVHALGRHAIGYDQPITITQRQPRAAIQGALRQTLAPIQQIFTDTHGYSAWAMGPAKHVGYDLCPRLKDFPDRR